MTKQQRPVALITGGGRRRVGFAIADHLAKNGYDIALHYHRSEEEAVLGRDELRDRGVQCETFQADVSDEEQVQAMVAAVVERFERIDLLAATASVWRPIEFADVTAADLRENFEVNTLGVFLAAKFAGEVMVQQERGGAIVTFGDWAIERPYLNHAAYFVAKGAMPTLTRVLALELGHKNPNVRVNCIHPGPVLFPPDASEAEREQLVDNTLLKRGDCPDTVADAVLFLATNSFITGVCLPVDGGRHMYSPGEVNRQRGD